MSSQQLILLGTLCLIASPVIVMAAYFAGIVIRFVFDQVQSGLERHRWRQLKRMRGVCRAQPVLDERSSILTFRRIHERQEARRGI